MKATKIFLTSMIITERPTISRKLVDDFVGTLKITYKSTIGKAIRQYGQIALLTKPMPGFFF